MADQNPQPQTDPAEAHDHAREAHDHAHEAHDHAHEAHDHAHDEAHEHEHEPEHEHEHGQDAETGMERGEQTVTVEDAGPARKRLVIEVPESRITRKLEDSYKKLKTDAVIPGFRRGRAPRRLIERRFGQGLRDDVRSQLLSECYTQAIEDQELDVIGEPDISDVKDIKLPESGPLKFSVEVEVSPQVELPSFEGLTVTRPRIEVNQEQIDAEVKDLRRRHGRQVAMTDGPAIEGDYLTADVRILAGQGADPADEKAETIVHAPGTYILVTGADRQFKGQVAGIMVEDLGRRLAGRKIGDAEVISMTGPSGHENEKIKDQPITIAIRIEGIERLEPAGMESLLEQVGLASEEELRQRMAAMLESRRQRLQQAALHEQIANYLLEKASFELPAELTGRQTARVLHRRGMDMLYKGVPEEEVRQRIAEMRAASEEDARKQLKLFFLLDQAAKELDIDVSESDVNGRIAMLAVQQGRRPEKLRQQMTRNGEIEHLYLQIREQKTLDTLLEKVQVVEGEAVADNAQK